MTKKESAEKIIEQGGACVGVFCAFCPFHGTCDRGDYRVACPKYKGLAQAYLDSRGPELPSGHPWADEKPTPEETEHPSELEIQKRATEILDNALAANPSRGFTQSDVNDARNMSTATCQLELLWDIRELLKHSLDQSYCVEQAINNAGR